METSDYLHLLHQAEQELGTTPGAYCSRKAALRAMELLQAAGQAELDNQHQLALAAAVEGRAVIERQAYAIAQLEANRTGTEQHYRKKEPHHITGADLITKRIFTPSPSTVEQRLAEEMMQKLDDGELGFKRFQQIIEADRVVWEKLR